MLMAEVVISVFRVCLCLSVYMFLKLYVTEFLIVNAIGGALQKRCLVDSSDT